MALGRHDEAMAQIDYAVQLDPLSLVVQTAAGIVLHFGRKYDLAIERFKAALAADPSIQIVYFHLGRVYSAIGDYSNAIAQLEKVSSRFPTAIAVLGAAYAKAGQKSKALDILQELKRTSESRYVGPLPFAVLYGALGNRNTALKFYDKAFRARDGFVPFLGNDPNADEIRSDPRFRALLRRLRLPPKAALHPVPSP